jgi:hypothetical protein
MSYRTIETAEGSPTFAALNPNTSKISWLEGEGLIVRQDDNHIKIRARD